MEEIDFEKEIPFIRKRCPHLKGDELLEAEERFRQYVRICLKIYLRLEAEEKERESKKKKFDFSLKGHGK